jgi:hypothetical protein
VQKAADLLYSPTVILFAAFGYCATGLAVGIVAFTSGHSALLFLAGACFGVAAFLVNGRRRFVANLERVRDAQSHLNPLDGALLVIDLVDARRLGELASQMDILPSPARRERSRVRKRSGGITVPGSPSPTASYESAASETAVYELPEDPSKLVRDLVGSLQRSGQIELGVADVPQVSVDEPLNENEIESLLVKELSLDAEPLALRDVARDVASILGSGLSSERLEAAKLTELAGLVPGTYVLMESEWSPRENKSELLLRLETLHPPGEPGVTAETRVNVPKAMDVSVTVQLESVAPRFRARMMSTFPAGVFGEVLAIDAGEVRVWPLAVFSRSPKSKL